MKDINSWENEYCKRGAYWVHDGNPKRPHAMLTSGKCSDGFFNSRLILPRDESLNLAEDQRLLRRASEDLVSALADSGFDYNTIGAVVGPQTGATRLAEFLWQTLFYKYEVPDECDWSSPAKHEEGGVKSMVFPPEHASKIAGKKVLLCEDVISTGGSVELTAKAAVELGGEIAPFVLTLVNRSGLAELDGRKIISLISKEMHIWEPSECPLCKVGSVPIRPKDPPNWILLNAHYGQD